MTPGFAFPSEERQSAQRIAHRRERFTTLGRLFPTSKFDVRVEGDTAIIRGTVANEHDRRLVARVLLLEPTVDTVDNRLAVASTP